MPACFKSKYWFLVHLVDFLDLISWKTCAIKRLQKVVKHGEQSTPSAVLVVAQLYSEKQIKKNDNCIILTSIPTRGPFVFTFAAMVVNWKSHTIFEKNWCEGKDEEMKDCNRGSSNEYLKTSIAYSASLNVVKVVKMVLICCTVVLQY